MSCSIAAVIIGRNEGLRLERCIASVKASKQVGLIGEIIYVDCGSQDDSILRAHRAGVRALALDPEHPSAALARNAGWRAASSSFVLFLDGDCILDPDFLPQALSALDSPDIAVVFGETRELHSEASFFTRAYDLHWQQTTVGEAEFCLGCGLFRRGALDAVAGYHADLIADEEPELSHRLRKAGYRMRCIASPMVRHDLGITNWRQYWRRLVRKGYGMSLVARRVPYAESPQYRGASRRSSLLALAYVAALIAALLSGSLLLAAAIPAILLILAGWQGGRFWRRGESASSSLAFGLHSQLRVFPMLWGRVLALTDRRTGQHRILEYKHSVPIAPFWERHSAPVYRALAAASGAVLGRIPGIQTLFVHRSVASGEAVFPLSDLDLGVVLNADLDPADEAACLVALHRRLRTLRAVTLRVGEALVLRADEVGDWVQQDPYRASLNRRSAFVVAGQSLRFPESPVEARDAAMRLAFWFETYLPTAFRSNNQRNLRKFLLEIWNCWAVGMGLVDEPFLTRREVYANWIHREGEQGYRVASRSPWSCYQECFSRAGTLCQRIFGHSPPLRSPIIRAVNLGPRSKFTLLVVVPEETAEPPPEAYRNDAMIVTPGVWRLYVQCVNPLAWEALPQLRLPPPERDAWLRYLRSLTLGQRLRVSGFGQRGLANEAAVVDTARQLLSSLERGETPQSIGPYTGNRADSVTQYFTERYPCLRKDLDSLRARVLLMAEHEPVSCESEARFRS